jgi:probable F420-dependent oxidoreductase
MKVRIGIGLGAGALDATEIGEVAGAVAANGLDSLWLSEVLTGRTLDPLVALSWCAALHPELKLGTTMLLPGRNPLRLAKSLASLDRLSAGRLLVTFVPGLASPPERASIGVPLADRGTAIDEILPVLRRLWSGETVTWSGWGVALEDVSLSPTPVQDPLEIWLGGMAPAALRRCGRLADGWLPSLCTPPTAAAGREVIDTAAAAAGRSISDEHFGVSIGYATGPLSSHSRAALAARATRAARLSPGHEVDVDEVVPIGWEQTRRLVERFIAVGFSKFVLRPIDDPPDRAEAIAGVAGALGDLQT